MTWLGITALATTALALTAGARAQIPSSPIPSAFQTPSPTWAGSRVYAFELGYVLDLNSNQRARPPKRFAEVKDCSDRDYFCVDEVGGDARKIFSFVVPKRCSDPTTGTNWTLGSVRTTVIASEAKSGMYFIAPSKRSSVVYRWHPVSGIVSIIVGQKDEDIAGQIAAAHGIPADQLENASALITFDNLAGCNGR